jgi:hypothetical protein
VERHPVIVVAIAALKILLALVGFFGMPKRDRFSTDDRRPCARQSKIARNARYWWIQLSRKKTQAGQRSAAPGGESLSATDEYGLIPWWGTELGTVFWRHSPAVPIAMSAVSRQLTRAAS